MNEGNVPVSNLKIEIDNLKENHQELKEVVKENTSDIQILKQSNMELKYKLTEIQNSQSEIKLSINENQNKLLDTITGLINSTVSTDNQIKLMDRKEIWGILALIVGGLLTYFGLK